MFTQVIQLQGDQRKNVSTFLVQVVIIFFLLLVFHNLTYGGCWVSLCLMVWQTGRHSEERANQDSWILNSISMLPTIYCCYISSVNIKYMDFSVFSHFMYHKSLLLFSYCKFVFDPLLLSLHSSVRPRVFLFSVQIMNH